jgi:ferrochelatase
VGTPDDVTVTSVRRYLSEFLSDPAIIRLPGVLSWMNRALGSFIARRRASRSLELYRRIWSDRGSPLRAITEDQATALEHALPRGWRVFYAMRYGKPSIPQTLRHIEANGIDDLVVVPMYPQYSGTTTGTALRQVYEYLKHDGHALHVTMRSTWCDDHGYISAQTRLIEEHAKAHGLTPDDTFLVFSTHGLPVSHVKRGDPYPAHVARTVGLIGQRLDWPADRMTLAYQSRMGPVEWLAPHTDAVLTELARAGERQVLVCPISFTVDCLETLEEIDLGYRALFEKNGGRLYRCPALNTYGPFISALKHLVLRGPRPMACRVRSVDALRPAKSAEAQDERGLDSFVMVGVSLRGRLGAGRGPALAYADPEGLRRVKRSQVEMPALLETVQKQTDIREAWVWNTCHRFELYGWLDNADSPERTAEESIDGIRQHLLGHGAHNGRVNVLRGTDALHHLLRTAAGLNSGLPGERDVLQQLEAACRLADRAGTAGTRTRRLLDNVTKVEREVRLETAWGQFNPDYCHVAIARIADAGQLDLPSSHIVVIGGSTTSASVLTALTERLGVPSRQLTLLYRGHRRGGQIKLLRRAIGQGRRIRVQSYCEQQVLDAIADADVVFFGIDSAEPVLTAESIRTGRGWVDRPLTIYDFNMFGSTRGLDTLEGVTLHELGRLENEVTTFANEMCSLDEFTLAVAEAEAFLIERGLNGNGHQGSQRGRSGDRTTVSVRSTTGLGPLEVNGAVRSRQERLVAKGGEAAEPETDTARRQPQAARVEGRRTVA